MMFCPAPLRSGVGAVLRVVVLETWAMAAFIPELWPEELAGLSVPSTAAVGAGEAVVLVSEAFCAGMHPAAEVAQSGGSGLATVPAVGLLPPDDTVPARLVPMGFKGVEFLPR